MSISSLSLVLSTFDSTFSIYVFNASTSLCTSSFVAASSLKTSLALSRTAFKSAIVSSVYRLEFLTIPSACFIKLSSSFLFTLPSLRVRFLIPLSIIAIVSSICFLVLYLGSSEFSTILPASIVICK